MANKSPASSALGCFLRSFRRTPTSADAFKVMAKRYRKRLRLYHRKPLTTGSGKKVGVIISPWQRTAVPFYLMEWALRLRGEGADVEFVWDVWPRSPSDPPTSEEKTIRDILQMLEQRHSFKTVVPNSDIRLESSCRPRLHFLAFEAITRQRGCEPANDEPAVLEEERKLAERLGSIEQFLSDRSYRWILLPGGVWGGTGIYWEACSAKDVDLTTFDSGPGLLCFQHGGPAAHFPDLSSSMKRLSDACFHDDATFEAIRVWVDHRIGVRRSGNDDFQLQPKTAISGICPADIIVPLNYRLDTAAMCRQKLFSGINEWIEVLVEWASKHPDRFIVFRQHPCEKIEAYRSKEDYSWILQRAPNVRFIPAAESVNTYDLIENCRLVLPYSSRVGIEASLFGKPVVLAASTYYESLPFAQVAKSRDDYFEKIDQCLSGAVVQTPKEKRSAYAAYYVAESFGLLKTRFTPIPSDFDHWVERSPEALWREDENVVFLEAATTRRPAADLFLDRLLKNVP